MMMKKKLGAVVFLGIGVSFMGLLWKPDLGFSQHDSAVENLKSTRRERPQTIAPFKKTFPNSLTQESAKKILILEEILESKNDNDPRLDSEFSNLSLETKDAFINKYSRLKPEDRNEKGTIVYLLGKNIQSDKDLEFFQSVMAEAPCLSLGDCSKALPLDSIHDESQQQTTLVYPQLVAIKSVERYLQQNPNSHSARQILQLGIRSKNWVIRQMANDVLASAQKLSKAEGTQ